jgi:osmotically-inducible protein OsmY
VRLTTLLSLGLVTASLVLNGCSSETRDQYGAASQQAGQAIKKDTEIAGKEIKVAADKTKIAADNLLETTKVKSALGEASGLSTKNIDVDTDSLTKVITLKGSVPDEKQKNQAETIAKGIAGTEFKVVDNLKIA